MMSTMVGTAKLKLTDQAGTSRNLTLDNVLYVPNASSNLISVSKLLKTQHRIVFDNSACEISNKNNGTTIKIPMKRNAFDLHVNPDKKQHCRAANNNVGMSQVQLYHNRLAHASEKYIRKAVPKEKLDGGHLCNCEACIKGGIKKKPFNKQQQRQSKRADRKQNVPATTSRLDKVMRRHIHPVSRPAFSPGQHGVFYRNGCTHQKDMGAIRKEQGALPRSLRQMAQGNTNGDESDTGFVHAGWRSRIC
jgi:hypothetical protein